MKKKFQILLVLILCTRLTAINDNLIISESFPAKLSEFGFFLDDSAQIPQENVIPYELISTLFSDYSYKQRWVYVPNNKKAQYEENWVFNFPVGSALIKTFYYPVDERNPDLGMNLLETRLLLRIYGHTLAYWPLTKNVGVCLKLSLSNEDRECTIFTFVTTAIQKTVSMKSPFKSRLL